MKAGKQERLDIIFMKLANEMATMSTCSRVKVGCVITINNRIISTGINGTPSGFKNCDEIRNYDFNNEHERIDHHRFSEYFEMHSEQNAIVDALKREQNLEGATLYTTIAPCSNCAKLIVSSGIKRVVYSELYDRDANMKLESLKKVIEAYSNNEFYCEYNGIDLLRLLSYDPNDNKIKIQIEKLVFLT